MAPWTVLCVHVYICVRAACVGVDVLCVAAAAAVLHGVVSVFAGPCHVHAAPHPVLTSHPVISGQPSRQGEGAQHRHRARRRRLG
eukprot:1404245-Rhodomonas_salina.4